MKRKLLIIGMTGILIGGSLTGCGQKEEPTTEEITTEVTTEATTEATTEEEVVLKTIGEKDEDSYEVILTNHTGQDIVGVEIFDTESNEYCENLLSEEDVFAVDEQRILYYPKVDSEETTEVSEDTVVENGEKLVSVGYDIRITLADETEYVLHSFPFGDMEEGDILIEDEVAYVENDEISTKEAELAILEDNQKAEVTKQSSNTGASSGKQTSQTANTPATEAPAPAPAPEPAPAPAPEPAPSVDQGTEGCIGDEGLTY